MQTLLLIAIFLLLAYVFVPGLFWALIVLYAIAFLCKWVISLFQRPEPLHPEQTGAWRRVEPQRRR